MAAKLGAALVFLLVLACLSGSCCGITLVGNGYRNILVAINPTVPENPQLIHRIKEMLGNGSTYLHQATMNKLYLEKVTILVPPTWTHGSYSRANTEVYDQANVLIDKPNRVYGDNPYVLQYGECGAPSQYMHLTPEFMLDDIFLKLYGPRGRLFVHEWAHLRWGVYDEYADSKVFYLNQGKPQATRCSEDIKGIIKKLSNPFLDCDIDPMTGLPTEDCVFLVQNNQETRASIMYQQSVDSVNTFCTKETHNILAPNRQNRMCDEMAVEEVISTRSIDSSVYKDLLPIQAPPPVNIAVVQRQQRVVCLVLDVSGSMQGVRIMRQHQAATLFIEKIIEDQAYVGIVTFSTSPSIVKHLTLIDGEESRKALVDALPTAAAGGTEICLGLAEGLKELGRDGNTSGDEIIFLTDGESNSPMNCLPQVERSDTIVNTIALGNNADKELERMAEVSGGHFLLAADSLDSNALVDVFASLTSSDGDLTQQTIQLESTGSRTTGWFNGSVSVDRTVGKNTSFLVLYESSPLDILVQSPNGGVTYHTSSFKHQSFSKSYKLNIPGAATAGRWTYSLMNRQPEPQSMSMTVTSQAVSADIDPVMVRAHINQLLSDGRSPLVVYAVVQQGGVPVTLADVTATLLSEHGNSYPLNLLDNGAGADALRNDGVYSRFFIPNESGRYSLKVKVQNDEGKARYSFNGHSGAFYIPGYVDQDGSVVMNPPRPPVSEDDQQADVGIFSRTTIGESFSVEIDPSVPRPTFPPNKITDLNAHLENSTVVLTWTAPGEDFDVGKAKAYEIRFSQDPEHLRSNFSDAEAVNTSSLRPQDSGSLEQFSFNTNITERTTLFFAARAQDAQDTFSEISNLAQVTKFLPVRPAPSHAPHGLQAVHILATVVVAVSTAMLVTCG